MDGLTNEEIRLGRERRFRFKNELLPRLIDHVTNPPVSWIYREMIDLMDAADDGHSGFEFEPELSADGQRFQPLSRPDDCICRGWPVWCAACVRSGYAS